MIWPYQVRDIESWDIDIVRISQFDVRRPFVFREVDWGIDDVDCFGAQQYKVFNTGGMRDDVVFEHKSRIVQGVDMNQSFVIWIHILNHTVFKQNQHFSIVRL